MRETTYLIILASTLLLATLPGTGSAQVPIRSGSTEGGPQCARIGAAFRPAEGELLVVGVTTGGPAAKAGLRDGDRVTRINGLRASLLGLDSLVRALSPGDTTFFQLRRDDHIHRIRIVAAPGRCLPQREDATQPRGDEGAKASRDSTGEQVSDRRLPRITRRGGWVMPPRTPPKGEEASNREAPVQFRPDIAMSIGARSIAGAELSELNPKLAEYFDGVTDGLLILRVVPDTPGARGGLEPGDVIIEAGGERVRTIPALRRLIAEAPGKSIPLTIVRKGKRDELQLPVER